MNGEENNIIIGRKKKEIDDEGPVSKKVKRAQKKNLNKTINAITAKEQFVKKEQKVEEPSPPKPKQKKGPDRMVDDIKAVLTCHKEETIRRILEKHNYSQAEAMDELFNIPEDDVKDSLMGAFDDFEKKEEKKPINKEEEANKFLDDIYESLAQEGLQLNPTEFQELFNEITFIIQEDQRTNGVDLLEINEFVDSCMSIKDLMMEGQQFYIDDNDPLYRNTEQFMYDIIQKNALLEQKRQEQFPTLGSLPAQNPKKNNKSLNTTENEKNLVEKIQEGYEKDKTKEQFFTPSRVPITKTTQSYQGSIYSLENDYQSHAAVLQLSKEYNNMGIENLKFIYDRLLRDVNLCKQFLQKYYPEKRSAVKKETGMKEERKIGVRKSSYQYKRKTVDENYRNWTLSQIREELDHLFKLKSMFRMTRGKITNQSYRKELQRLSCREDSTIRRLEEACRIKLIEEMVSSHPQYVDLHGYREEEVDDVMNEIRDMVRAEFRRGNSQLQTKRVGGSIFCVVKVMTGKGRHSKYGKSVLKPLVMEWSADQDFKAVQTEDSVDVYIQIG